MNNEDFSNCELLRFYAVHGITLVCSISEIEIHLDKVYQVSEETNTDLLSTFSLPDLSLSGNQILTEMTGYNHQSSQMPDINPFCGLVNFK